MVLGTQLVNCIEQYAEVVGVDVGRYAVAEVEYVPRPLAIAGERIGNGLPDDFRRLSQGGRDRRSTSSARCATRATPSPSSSG